jgi:arylsulfatase A-like enzyme/HEAT repeat protein
MQHTRFWLARLRARFDSWFARPRAGLDDGSAAPAPGAAALAHANPRAVPGAAWLIGAVAGGWLAFADYGALWLWLPVWRDRGGLLLRLLLTLIPCGAALGALLAWLGALSLRWAQRSPARAQRRWALLWALLAAPGLRVLAWKLCSGGMMSRLPFHAVLEWGLSLALPLALFAWLRLGWKAWENIALGTWSARRGGAGLLALSFALCKLNQSVLPNLYDYLHAILALLAWCACALGLTLLSGSEPRLQTVRAWAERPRRGLRAGALLSGVLLANLLTLEHNLNVRVAMFDPRAPSSRALLAALDPLLRRLEQRGRAPARRPAAEVRQDTRGLPAREGAHVLLVTIDALRADRLGAYGYARPVSPGLDAFAKQSWMFRRAYAQAPHSSYSLSSLHTSEYLHELVELGRPLPATTLATTLRAHGYHTAAFFTDGVFHTEGHKLSSYRDGAFGFALFDHTNFEAQDHTDRVLAEAERIRGQGEPPSLLWVHYFDVHEPYQETSFGSGDSDRYDSEIKHVDRELTRLIAELERRFEREIVIAISADHGEEFREHGGVYHGSTLFDEQVRVPLLLRLPGASPALVEAPVEVIDIAPTLLGMVGVEAPPSMRGRDLRALVEARAGTHEQGVAGGESATRPVFSAVLTKRMALRWPFKLIADLRFGLFELYDLERDPHERNNLAHERPDKLEELRGDVYGWLDSLETAPRAQAAAEDPRARALRWGRLGDRRAVEPMSALLLDASAPGAQRVEAGQILAKLADESSAPALLAALNTQPAEVAAEAAIALGRMFDERARPALERLVHVEDPYLRARAAVSLGRLRDPRAVPALIDALWVAPTLYEREEAVRWLGRLRDPRAVEPLISVIPEFGMRYLVAVALGQIGDPRAFDALADMLSWEERTNIRDEVVRGLGLLGDARAIELLLPVLAREPALKNSGESLVRLGAIDRGRLGGTDLAPALAGRAGLYGCQAGPLLHDWDYLERTSCKARGTARLQLAPPAAPGAGSAQLLVRLKRDDAPDPVQVRFLLDGHELPAQQIDATFREPRFELAQSPRGRAELTLICADPAAVLVLDHALIAPPSGSSLAAASDPAKAAQDAQRLP